ncbi:MAG: hypothetical protein FJ398_03880 [Verrucomicrobia bacterium]|nr:hypothetical protein [Verrucomicrobiota bacterium]
MPAPLRAVLENTRPLELPRGTRLPLFVLPISNALRGSSDELAEKALSELAVRGIGYTVAWNPNDRAQTLAEGLRSAKFARRVGLPVAVDATACLDGFFNGDPATLHIDGEGQPFADLSFDPGRRMGCPFALVGRVPVIRERVEFFLKAYAKARARIDFVFADWEIDGPIEWNDAWANSRKCQRCRARIKDLDDFRAFQRQLREVRSDLQRRVFAQPVRSRFPKALVGNYGVYPHNGRRHWYDYYERLPEGAPFVEDQRARYREWAHEFGPCRYSLAMPVVYTWYPIYHWYDFANSDYRWFYNLLLVGSNAGQSTPRSTPIVTFVHRNTTAPPPNADPGVRPFSPEQYQELLWHLLLRGHDGFFVWCLQEELAEETRLVHEVYAASLAYREFLDRGQPVTFEVPKQPAPIVSGLRLGSRVLVRRTDFEPNSGAVRLKVGKQELKIPRSEQSQVIPIQLRRAAKP